MGELYDADVFEWSEQQARLLRQHARPKPLSDATADGPGWTNLIGEIESVGREQLHAVESLLVLSLAHDLRAESWPLLQEEPAWRAEARRYRDDATDRFTPAMRPKIDLAQIYRRSLRAVPETVDGLPPMPVPRTCPVTLDDLLSEA